MCVLIVMALLVLVGQIERDFYDYLPIFDINILGYVYFKPR